MCCNDTSAKPYSISSPIQYFHSHSSSSSEALTFVSLVNQRWDDPVLSISLISLQDNLTPFCRLQKVSSSFSTGHIQFEHFGGFSSLSGQTLFSRGPAVPLGPTVPPTPTSGNPSTFMVLLGLISPPEVLGNERGVFGGCHIIGVPLAFHGWGRVFGYPYNQPQNHLSHPKGQRCPPPRNTDYILQAQPSEVTMVLP